MAKLKIYYRIESEDIMRIKDLNNNVLKIYYRIESLKINTMTRRLIMTKIYYRIERRSLLRESMRRESPRRRSIIELKVLRHLHDKIIEGLKEDLL